MVALAPPCGRPYIRAIGSKESHQSFQTDTVYLRLFILSQGGIRQRGIRRLLVLCPRRWRVAVTHFAQSIRAIITPSIVGGSSSGQVRSGEEGPRFRGCTHTCPHLSPRRAAHCFIPRGRHGARRTGSDGWFADDNQVRVPLSDGLTGVWASCFGRVYGVNPPWPEQSACVCVNHSAIDMFNHCNGHFWVSLLRAPSTQVNGRFREGLNVLTVALRLYNPLLTAWCHIPASNY